MPVELKREGLPDELVKQLAPDEKLYFFSPVEFRGGCLSFLGRSNFWAALTDKRFLYHAKVKEGDTEVEKEGTLQVKNISSMEIVEVKEKGCLGLSSKKYWELRVNAQGVIIGLPFPNKQKGLEIRAIHHELTEGT